MLYVNPKMLNRLDELETDLLDRRARAQAENWIGEIEGIDMTRTFLRAKRDDTHVGFDGRRSTSVSRRPREPLISRRRPNDVLVH